MPQPKKKQPRPTLATLTATLKTLAATVAANQEIVISLINKLDQKIDREVGDLTTIISTLHQQLRDKMMFRFDQLDRRLDVVI